MIKKSLALGLTLSLIIAVGPFVQSGLAQQPESISFADVLTFPLTPSSQVVGYSRLVRNDGGIAITLHTSGLVPGDVYSLWWLVDAREGRLFVNASGAIADSAGKAHFVGRLFVGRIPQSDGKGVVAGGGFMFDTPRTAAVSLVVHGHGPAILSPMRGQVDDQLTTVNGGCDVNNCLDVQISTHVK